METGTTIPIINLIKEANLTIMVKDLDTSISFYESLGMKLNNRWGNHYAQLSVPGMIIGLHPTEDKSVQGGSGNASIGFTSENFEEVKNYLQKISVPFTTRSEEGGEFLHFTDPDGTQLYFIKPKW